MKDFWDIVRELRQERGYSQAEMGKLLGVSATQYYRKEKYKPDPFLKEIKTIAKHFGVKLSYLLGEEPEPLDVAAFTVALRIVEAKHEKTPLETLEKISWIREIYIENLLRKNYYTSNV